MKSSSASGRRKPLLRIHDELETRVEKRTAELRLANEVLEAEMQQRLRARNSVFTQARSDFACLLKGCATTPS